MKFLVDAQLPPEMARWISSRSHVAAHVSELGLSSADDKEIWDRARREREVLVTKDDDFVDRWLLKSDGIALVWIRRGNCSNRVLLEWIEPLWADVLRRLEQGEMFIELRA